MDGAGFLWYDEEEVQGGLYMSEVILYVKENCGLCEEVKGLLSLFDVAVVLVDIGTDPVLLDKYMLEVPVLKIGEEELDYRNIDYFELMKRLQ
ncbi:glutaredoxin family protein [Halobacillus litoralis]|uniref:Glutaredoxin family protein n=2 Tax=Halobacillus litoralis TaxID=45668 RepID=A0A845F723_9BACI|nr:glutaredoxin family protein [Halobacillus litoralis]